MTNSSPETDVAVVGGGPVGLAAAILAQRVGARVAVLEKGALCNSVIAFPTGMSFFSIGRNIEIAGHPMIHTGPRPTRAEALAYYGRVAEVEQVDLRSYTRVTRIDGREGDFTLQLEGARPGDDSPPTELRARYVIVATGYFDQPNRLGVPGEDLPHVSNRYTEAAPYWGRRVAIIGGSNSAVETALDLHYGGGSGTTVTLIHRGESVRPSVKYWMRPDFENRVKEGSVAAHFNARVTAITPTAVQAGTPDRPLEVPADFVFVFIGFRAVDQLVRDAGATFTDDGAKPALSERYETSIPGLFVVGSAGFGRDTRTVFIENGRDHAALATAEIAARLSSPLS